ncbi:hypothetical protein GOBAR_AA06668 [Gossypium barbadense]|uniref:Uncharacterized protein n=1 Tax=Gossypium barbadense TaxID=3634 RepID=A0A2P5YE78_GOSBA|nr:hypothetical protein GOBAR_AA06668 [Gossypium barbadense]
MEVGHVFVEDVRDAMVANRRMARSMNVEIYSRHLETLRVMDNIACAKVNLNVKQFVDDVYTLERTLRVWKNEFPVLPDLFTWEVLPTNFELVPDRGLRRNPKGCPQSSKICNEIDIREKSERSRCGLCRLPGHNRNKYLQQNYHVGQSSRSSRN